MDNDADSQREEGARQSVILSSNSDYQVICTHYPETPVKNKAAYFHLPARSVQIIAASTQTAKKALELSCGVPLSFGTTRERNVTK